MTDQNPNKKCKSNIPSAFKYKFGAIVHKNNCAIMSTAVMLLLYPLLLQDKLFTINDVVGSTRQTTIGRPELEV